MMENDGKWWKMMENDGKWWKMMENDGKWWKMMENDSLIDEVWCFAYVLTCYLSLRLKNKKPKQQLGYVFGCRDSMLIPQIPLSSKAHVPASQERPRAGDESGDGFPRENELETLFMRLTLWLWLT